jgi:hypothetical protein
MMPLNACSNSICRPSGSAGFLTALEEENRDAAERIKALMLTFDDLVKLDARRSLYCAPVGAPIC